MAGYIDMHCDTLSAGLQQKTNTITKLEGTMIDIERLKKSDCAAQFFAMFLTQKDQPGWYGLETMPDLTDLLMMMYEVFQNTLEANKDCMRFAGSYEDLVQNEKEGLISAFLTIENGYPVLGNLDNLKKFYDLGVRLITLTWNDPNCFGQNHSSDPVLMNQGLTDFGKEAIPYMNELGIIIDVSHLNDGGFYDVAKYSKKPFVASHSDCRALCPATRNLTDDMIRTLSQCGGVSGLNFEPSFLNMDREDPKSRVSSMCEHAEHFINVGGIECLGIGTDFDGIGGDLEIGQCTDMHLLFEALHKRGLTYDEIDKIRYGNVARVIREAM